MTPLATRALPDQPAAPAPPSAAELAARIAIPRRLPPRHDGQPLRHLSHSSYTRFLLCPEDWRRYYLQGERPPITGAMILGRCVDDALTTYHRQLLAYGEPLTPDQLQDAYRDAWQRELASEQGIQWEPELPAAHALALGLDALTLTLAELVPRLGDPVAVQRQLDFTLAPELEWTIQCHLDLETVRPDEHEQPVPAVVDYKVKGTLISQAKADHDPQAGLYLAARWLAGQPAHEFAFAQIAKPGICRFLHMPGPQTHLRGHSRLRVPTWMR